MNDIQMSYLHQVAVGCVRSALPHALARPHAVAAKSSGSDIVTDADHTIEQLIRTTLTQRFPTHAINGEEYGTHSLDPASPYQWYIDPIDGTTNYAAGLPWYAISLALIHNDTPTVGVVALPTLGVILSAGHGLGIHIDGEGAVATALTETLHTTPPLSGGVVMMEWDIAQPWAGMDRVIQSCREHDLTTRIMGSGTSAIAMVAIGSATMACIGAYDPIDHGASACLAREHDCGLWSLATHEPLDLSRCHPEPFYVAPQDHATELRRILSGPVNEPRAHARHSCQSHSSDKK